MNKLIEAGTPVIDMDTLIAPLDSINIHSFLAPDNEFMGASVTQALVDAIGGEGTMIMTQGALGHTGAQGRARGFESVVKKFPKIQVLDTQPADWDVTKVARIWETLLTKYPKISAAYFHNDDMALAAYNVMRRTTGRRSRSAAATPCRRLWQRSAMDACWRRCAIRRAVSMAGRSWLALRRWLPAKRPGREGSRRTSSSTGQ